MPDIDSIKPLTDAELATLRNHLEKWTVNGQRSLTSSGIIEKCGDHPDLEGYVVGPDDGKCVLSPTRDAACHRTMCRLLSTISSLQRERDELSTLAFHLSRCETREHEVELIAKIRAAGEASMKRRYGSATSTKGAG